MSTVMPTSWMEFYDNLPVDAVLPHLIDPSNLFHDFASNTLTRDSLSLALVREPDSLFLCSLGVGAPLAIVHHLTAIGDSTAPGGSRFVALTGWDSRGTPLTIPNPGLLASVPRHVPALDTFAALHGTQSFDVLQHAVVDGTTSNHLGSFVPIPAAVQAAVLRAPDLYPTRLLRLVLDEIQNFTAITDPTRFDPTATAATAGVATVGSSLRIFTDRMNPLLSWIWLNASLENPTWAQSDGPPPHLTLAPDMSNAKTSRWHAATCASLAADSTLQPTPAPDQNIMQLTAVTNSLLTHVRDQAIPATSTVTATSALKPRIARLLSNLSATDPSMIGQPPSSALSFFGAKDPIEARLLLVEAFGSTNHFVNFTPGFVHAIHSGHFVYNRPTIPLNFTVFATGARAGWVCAEDTTEALKVAFKNSFRQAPSPMELAGWVKQEIAVPATIPEFLQQLANFVFLLEFFFGRRSLVALGFEQLWSFCHENQGHIYSLLAIDKYVLTKILFQADNNRDWLFRRALATDDLSTDDLMGTDHSALCKALRQCCVSVHLPDCLIVATDTAAGRAACRLPSQNVPLPPPVPTSWPDVPAPSSSPTKRARFDSGAVTHNRNVNPGWHVPSTTDFMTMIHPHRDRLLQHHPSFCLNWHVLGRCRDDCTRDHSVPDNPTSISVTNFMRDHRFVPPS